MKAIADQRPRLFKRSVIVFVLTIFVTLYWYLPLLINVNRFPVIGAIYEILWIGMVIVLFGMPFYSFIMWVKNKFDFRSLYLYSFLISSIGILVLITQFD